MSIEAESVFEHARLFTQAGVLTATFSQIFRPQPSLAYAFKGSFDELILMFQQLYVVFIEFNSFCIQIPRRAD
jgi:hypothetical protein